MVSNFSSPREEDLAPNFNLFEEVDHNDALPDDIPNAQPSTAPAAALDETKSAWNDVEWIDDSPVAHHGKVGTWFFSETGNQFYERLNAAKTGNGHAA